MPDKSRWNTENWQHGAGNFSLHIGSTECKSEDADTGKHEDKFMGVLLWINFFSQYIS